MRAALLLAVLASCGHAPARPVGRWSLTLSAPRVAMPMRPVVVVARLTGAGPELTCPEISWTVDGEHIESHQEDCEPWAGEPTELTWAQGFVFAQSCDHTVLVEVRQGGESRREDVTVHVAGCNPQ